MVFRLARAAHGPRPPVRQLAVGVAPGQTDARNMAVDMLNSVEPYGISIVVGDNNTFPLWYAQDVQRIRRDVTVANRRCSTPTGTCAG